MPQDNITTLEPTACLGFNGTVPNGLVAVEVDDEAFVAYPGGHGRRPATRRDGVCFLRGHTEDVTCVAASNDGRVLCTGQDAPLGSPRLPCCGTSRTPATASCDPGRTRNRRSPQDPEPARRWRAGRRIQLRRLDPLHDGRADDNKIASVGDAYCGTEGLRAEPL